MTYSNRRELIVNDVTRNRLRFIQIPSKRLKKDTGTQVSNSTFVFIADKVFGFPVVKLRKKTQQSLKKPDVAARTKLLVLYSRKSDPLTAPWQMREQA